MVVVHSSSSFSSTSAIQNFNTPANSGNDFQIFSIFAIKFIKTGKGRTTLVNTKSQFLQREVLNISPSATNIKFRCISSGLGHNAKRKQQELHEEIPHKCAGTKSRQSGNNEFYYSKEEENFHSKFSFRMDNMIALSYLMKMRGKKGRI